MNPFNERMLPYFPEAFLGHRPSLRTVAVSSFHSSHNRSFHAFIGYLTLEFHVLPFAETAESVHADDALAAKKRGENQRRPAVTIENTSGLAGVNQLAAEYSMSDVRNVWLVVYSRRKNLSLWEGGVTARNIPADRKSHDEISSLRWRHTWTWKQRGRFHFFSHVEDSCPSLGGHTHTHWTFQKFRAAPLWLLTAVKTRSLFPIYGDG